MHNQAALTGSQVMTPSRAYPPAPHLNDINKFTNAIAGKLARIKEEQAKIKNKNQVALRYQQAESHSSRTAYSGSPDKRSQQAHSNIYYNYPRNQEDPGEEYAQYGKFNETGSEYSEKSITSPKSTEKKGAYYVEQKTVKTQNFMKKEQVPAGYETISPKKKRLTSPNAFVRAQPYYEEDKKVQIYYPQHSSEFYNQEMKVMKKSKYMDGYGGEVKAFHELKETVSTTSSNKISKQLKIGDFELGRDLGRGKFGNVKVARHRKTGMVFSMKIINKYMVKQDKILHQLIKQSKIQSFLNHSHIVKLYSVFDDEENVYLLMELCCEGNLYEHMQRKGKLSEEETSDYMQQVCDAVRELHEHKIIHRDIKPENIVMCFGMVKICDFGWSTEVKGTLRETFCGSPLYISPELLKGELYDQKVDLWALGILAYEMMTGTIPFQIATERDLVKIVNSRITYPSWMSEIATSFLVMLLEKNPNHRCSIEQLCEHPFICHSK